MRIASSILLLTILAWTAAVTQDRRSDEEIVRFLDDQERVAALGRDILALERLWSDQFVVNAPNDQVVVGRTAVLARIIHDG